MSRLDYPVWITLTVSLKICRLLNGQSAMVRAQENMSEHAQWINKQLDMPVKAYLCLHKAVVWCSLR